MKNLRILMIGSAVLTLLFLRLLERSNVMTVLLFLLIAANVALAIHYAKKTDRPVVGWAIGAFLVPYICNVILALLPIKKSVVMKNLEQTAPAAPVSTETNEIGDKEDTVSSLEKLFTSFPATGNVFQISRGLLKKPVDLHLDNLRLFAVIITTNVKWRVTTTSSSSGIVHIDLLPEEDAQSLYEILEKAITGTHRDCVGFSVCLAEHGQKGMQFKLTDLRNKYPTLLAAAYRLRLQRKERLRQWLSGKASTSITGSYGTTVVLDKEGYHSGNKVTPWSEIGLIKLESGSFGPVHMYLLRKDSKGGIFSSWGAKHSLSIPRSKTHLYFAECNFWRELSENENCIR